MIERSWAAAAAGLLLVVVGCSKPPGGAPKPAASVAKQAKPAPVADIGKPVSEEEAKRFGDDMEEAARAGMSAINHLIDWGAMLDAASDGLGAPEDFRRKFKADGLPTFNSRDGFAAGVAATVANGGRYDLLCVHEVDGRRRALFRQINPEGGFGYQDYSLARQADGEVRAVDIYNLTSAEPLSASFRRVFIPLAAHESRGLLARLTGSESDLIKSLPKIQAMNAATEANQPARVLEIFDQLPASLKKEKAYELARIRAVWKLNDDARYVAAIDEFRANHPDDPAVDLCAIISYTFKKSYEKALECLDRLDKAVGGDPYLDALRGQTYLLMDQPEEARTAAGRSIRAEPELMLGYQVLVAATLRTKDYDATLDALRRLRTRAGRLSLDAFSKLPGFEEFARSPQFEEFRKEAGATKR